MALLAAAVQVEKIRYCFVGEESLKEHMCACTIIKLQYQYQIQLMIEIFLNKCTFCAVSTVHVHNVLLTRKKVKAVFFSFRFHGYI